MALLDVDMRGLTDLRGRIAAGRQDIHEAIEQESRRFAPLLIRSAQVHARGEVEKRIAQSGQAKVAKDGFVVSFARSGKVSGAKLSEIARPYEFGTSNPERYTEYASRSPKGKAYRVKRRTQAQIPRHVPTGRFLHPALADVTPKLVSAYVRAIVNTVTDA